jgi:hypothetical protein
VYKVHRATAACQRAVLTSGLGLGNAAQEDRATEGRQASRIPAVKARLLEGTRGLIVGIANDQ